MYTIQSDINIQSSLCITKIDTHKHLHVIPKRGHVTQALKPTY